MTWILQAILTAFALGFLAAAPIGPLNTVAIHRGLLGRWKHTLACGVGSALVDASIFAAVLLGKQTLVAALNGPNIHRLLNGTAAVVLLAIGGVFLYKAYHADTRTIVRIRRRAKDRPPRHLWNDVGTGILLTIVNPAALIYWTGASVPWLNQFPPEVHSLAVPWGLLGAAMGLLCWFSILSALVHFAPRRLGGGFFRITYVLCGVAIIGFGVYCAWHFLHA